MFWFLRDSQHYCHIISILYDNWLALFYQFLVDAWRRRALVCLDLLKQSCRVEY